MTECSVIIIIVWLSLIRGKDQLYMGQVHLAAQQLLLKYGAQVDILSNVRVHKYDFELS